MSAPPEVVGVLGRAVVLRVLDLRRRCALVRRRLVAAQPLQQPLGVLVNNVAAGDLSVAVTVQNSEQMLQRGAVVREFDGGDLGGDLLCKKSYFANYFPCYSLGNKLHVRESRSLVQSVASSALGRS